MCGIAGVMNLREALPPPPLSAVKAMVSALQHRGPDEAGVYRDARAALGHTRLSIIDLAGGGQPLANEDGSCWVVFNGEIFNFVELRAELETLGHRFRTRSDTEVIVHAFEAWGEAAFARFNGQFAIGLWHAAERKLVLARDRLGVRPLYFCEHAGRLWFASEVKALFAGERGIPRALDPAGLAETFTFWSVVPPQSVFRGVRELEPGHVLVFSARGRSQSCYWRPRYPVTPGQVFDGSLDEAAAEVRAALEEAVRLRMVRADVPVGAYLSGGLDSTLIAVLAQRAAPEGLRTFSLRFQDPRHDESAFQREALACLRSEHREIVVGDADIADAFPQVVWHAERPVLRTAPGPLMRLSRLARDSGIKVVLTGEGADEMFAGYDLFRESKLRRYWGRAPDSRRRPLLLGRLYPWLARSPLHTQAMAREFFGLGREGWDQPGFGHQPRWRSAAALQRLFSEPCREEARRTDVVARLLASLPGEFPRWSALAQDQYLETRTLLAGYLLSSQGDRMLMAHSVEGRFPFLDPNVVELANALPDKYKLRVLDEKHVLKRAAAGLVPESILHRAKQPFRAPDARALAGPHAPEAFFEALSETQVADAGVFEPAAVARLWRKCREAAARGEDCSNADNMALCGVLSTQLLHEQLVRKAPARAPEPRLTTYVDRLRPAPSGSPWALDHAA